MVVTHGSDFCRSYHDSIIRIIFVEVASLKLFLMMWLTLSTMAVHLRVCRTVLGLPSNTVVKLFYSCFVVQVLIVHTVRVLLYIQVLIVHTVCVSWCVLGHKIKFHSISLAASSQ